MFAYVEPLAPAGLAIYDALVAFCIVVVVLRNGAAVIQLAVAHYAVRHEAEPTRDAFDL